MSPRAGRALAGIAAGMLAVLVAAGALAAAPAASAVTADESGLPLEVLITEVSPQVLGVGQDLTLRVQVRNTGSGTVAQPRVLVHLDRNAFISRYSLDLWRGRGPQDALGSVVLQQDLTAPLDPGQTIAVDLTVTASAVALPSRLTSWGARGLAVQVDQHPRLRDGARPGVAHLDPQGQVLADPEHLRAHLGDQHLERQAGLVSGDSARGGRPPQRPRGDQG